MGRVSRHILGLISQTADANAPVFDAFESHRQSYIGPAGGPRRSYLMVTGKNSL